MSNYGHYHYFNVNFNPKKEKKVEAYPADLVFDPTLACCRSRSGFHTITTPRLRQENSRRAGLTPKPHHAHRHFCQLTWVASPAISIDFQPQTRISFTLLYHYNKGDIPQQGIPSKSGVFPFLNHFFLSTKLPEATPIPLS